MAGRAKKPSFHAANAAVPIQIGRLPADHDAPESAKALVEAQPEESDVKVVAAKLYGRGYGRSQIARTLMHHLVPGHKVRTDEQQLQQARNTLKKWEMQQSFRDLVYQFAVVELDMDTPRILQAVGRRAKRGRTDAARLALELTGRHDPKADVETNVTIQVANIPRPPEDERRAAGMRLRAGRIAKLPPKELEQG